MILRRGYPQGYFDGPRYDRGRRNLAGGSLFLKASEGTNRQGKSECHYNLAEIDANYISTIFTIIISIFVYNLFLMNQFGGSWTEAKMEIIVSYARAYLTIMNKQAWAKTLYFDGFAGSGLISSDDSEEIKKGTALRILDIILPRPFDTYYFVELDEDYKRSLEAHINTNYFGRNAHVVKGDCNTKLVEMAKYLKKNTNFRSLAFVDPYGMSVNWNSIEALKGLGIDLWILVPTGLGINRLLKKNGDIRPSWIKKLEQFLGMSLEEILEHFYKEHTTNTLFGEETIVEKERNAVLKCGELYRSRLSGVFTYVSDSFIMRNKHHSIMYHFMMATNNARALKIANDVIKPKYKS